MPSNYKKLADYIQLVNNRNKDLVTIPLLGVSIKKVLMPSIANIIGTDMSTYKLISKNQFAYGPVTSRNGDKISIALLEDYENAMVSQAYTVFEVIDEKELLPEYLMMWFRRPEFDRYARFKSHGSAREIFDWAEMCDAELPIPSIEKQQEIVREYNIIQNRITLNNQLISKLEETAQAIYKQWFVDFEFPDENGKPYKSNGGEMVWCKELEKEIPAGWEMNKLKNICSKIGSGSTPTGGKGSYFKTGISLIRSTNVYDFSFSLDDLAYINNIQAEKLKGAEVLENDVLFNITGVSVARCSIVPQYVLPARVNQHVMIIRAAKNSNLSSYILCTLCHSENKNKLLGISQSGSTREAITKAELENFDIIVPSSEIMRRFEEIINKVFTQKEIQNKEVQKLEELKDLLLAKMTKVETEKYLYQ
ncbi:restriction endonuclease subunit S [Flavobacterium agrisoli]|uniref:Restriction endonuclease subunit S n=1 Tax=Flavobacterium agrisoli TaxID=2793066 RepID=A0A934PHR0_9FLAO|nr:restriction endonuclease subunit S [Flavobacterium agrisoli]MBK0368247.1 restriction endonuclease subunit S [Flavobacterium agrisoli]